MTVFSKIIRKEIPANIVLEDDLCLAFWDSVPQAPVHIIIIPKKEISSMEALLPEHAPLMGHLMIKTCEIAKNLNLKMGYRVVINTLENGGQTVLHLHLHLLGNRKMTWPPG